MSAMLAKRPSLDLERQRTWACQVCFPSVVIIDGRFEGPNGIERALEARTRWIRPVWVGCRQRIRSENATTIVRNVLIWDPLASLYDVLRMGAMVIFACAIPTLERSVSGTLFSHRAVRYKVLTWLGFVDCQVWICFCLFRHFAGALLSIGFGEVEFAFSTLVAFNATEAEGRLGPWASIGHDERVVEGVGKRSGSGAVGRWRSSLPVIENDASGLWEVDDDSRTSEALDGVRRECLLVKWVKGVQRVVLVMTKKKGRRRVMVDYRSKNSVRTAKSC